MEYKIQFEDGLLKIWLYKAIDGEPLQNIDKDGNWREVQNREMVSPTFTISEAELKTTLSGWKIYWGNGETITNPDVAIGNVFSRIK